MTTHYYSGGKEVAYRTNNSLRYVHQDSLSSTSVTTNSAGAVVATIKYSPFGTTRSQSGTLDTDKKFTGQRLDDTGLYFYNARYYDATIGRFISPDSVVPDFKNPQNLNRYSYCLNNPLKYVDPSGHVTGTCVIGGETVALDYDKPIGGLTDEQLDQWITEHGATPYDGGESYHEIYQEYTSYQMHAGEIRTIWTYNNLYLPQTLTTPSIIKLKTQQQGSLTTPTEGVEPFPSNCYCNDCKPMAFLSFGGSVQLLAAAARYDKNEKYSYCDQCSPEQLYVEQSTFEKGLNLGNNVVDIAGSLYGAPINNVLHYQMNPEVIKDQQQLQNGRSYNQPWWKNN